MAHHNLKSHPEPFLKVCMGEKFSEFRINDRDFQQADSLTLEEFNPATQEYTGNKLDALVTHIEHGPAFGIPEGFCVLSIMTLD